MVAKSHETPVRADRQSDLSDGTSNDQRPQHRSALRIALRMPMLFVWLNW